MGERCTFGWLNWASGHEPGHVHACVGCTGAVHTCSCGAILTANPHRHDPEDTP